MTEANENGSQVNEYGDGYIRDSILDTEEMKKIFVRGIPSDAKDEEFKAFFDEQSGESVEVTIIQNKDTKKNNFGFVTFSKSETVDEILLKRSDMKFKGRALDVNRAVPKNSTAPGAHIKIKKLFVANLPKTGCSEDGLKKYFEARHPKKFGEIESVQLIKKKDEKGDKTEENKGYGFVMVSSEDMADKMAIQHAKFEFGGRQIELKKSVSTNEVGGTGGRGGAGRGGGRGGRGGAQNGSYGKGNYGGGSYGEYDPYYGGQYGWDYGWDGYQAGYQGQYGTSYTAQPARGGRGGATGRGGQRYNPY